MSMSIGRRLWVHRSSERIYPSLSVIIQKGMSYHAASTLLKMSHAVAVKANIHPVIVDPPGYYEFKKNILNSTQIFYHAGHRLSFTQYYFILMNLETLGSVGKSFHRIIGDMVNNEPNGLSGEYQVPPSIGTKEFKIHCPTMGMLALGSNGVFRMASKHMGNEQSMFPRTILLSPAMYEIAGKAPMIGEIPRLRYDLIPLMTKHMNLMSMMSGPMAPTADAKVFYRAWVKRFSEIQVRENADPRVAGYYHHKPSLVIKLAMLLTLNRVFSYSIDTWAFESALAVLERYERNLIYVLGEDERVGKLDPGYLRVSLSEYLRINARTDHQRVVRDYIGQANNRQILSALEAMIASGMVERYEETDGAMVKTFYRWIGEKKINQTS